MNSTSFSWTAWGAWPVAIASIVPSASPTRHASTSAALRSGGDIFVFVSKPRVASSVSVRWWGLAAAVTWMPRSRASRISATAPAVDTWATCKWAPVSSASIRSRATITLSAAAGLPGSPRRVETGPSLTTPSRTRLRSSAWTITGRSTSREYSSTRRCMPLSMIVAPASENATAPAFTRPTISVITSPARPFVAAAIGSTWTGAS